jgi:hypothetical protein
MGLINYARSDPSDPGTIADIANNGYNPHATASPQQAKAGNSPSVGAPSSASPNLTTTGPGGATSGTPTPAYQQLMDAYNNEIGQYNNDLGSVGSWQNANTDNTNKIYDTQAQTYNDQLNQGNSQLNQQTKVLNDSYQRSLNQLSNNMRTQNQGFQNALGIGGAGDSSAAQMGAYAMANEQNINRGYMNTDLNNQLDQIGLQRSSLGQNYNDEMRQLQAQHQSALSDIAQQYGQMQQEILHNISATNAAKASANAYLNQWANTQLQNLDQNVMSQAAAVNQKYGTLANTPQNLGYKPNFQAQAITTPQVAAQQGTSQQSAPSAPLLAPGATNNNQNTVPLASPNYNQNNQFNSAY